MANPIFTPQNLTLSVDPLPGGTLAELTLKLVATDGVLVGPVAYPVPASPTVLPIGSNNFLAQAAAHLGEAVYLEVVEIAADGGRGPVQRATVGSGGPDNFQLGALPTGFDSALLS